MNRHKQILIAFFTIVLLFSAIKIGYYNYDYFKTTNQAKALERQMDLPILEPSAAPTPRPETKTNQTILPEFEKLVRQNKDIVGWLKIEDTSISYPVMYTPQDPEFYLSHDFDQRKNKNGLPFLDYRCSVTEATTNWIIYGHNMKTKVMFHDLLDYKNEEYYKEHPIIKFDTLYEQGEYEIVAVILSRVYQKDEDVFKYYQFVNSKTQTEFDSFIQNIEQLALYDTGVTAQFGDRLLILSTCEYSTENGRLAVVASKQ